MAPRSNTLPQDRPDLWDNPMGTDGFEFVEFAAPDPDELQSLIHNLGFSAVARHRSKNVTLYRQRDINFILNAEGGSFAEKFSGIHGPCINAMAFRVKDAPKAFKHAVDAGATPHDARIEPMELNIPAVEGIGGSLLYLVDRYGDHDIYEVDFVPIPDADQHPFGMGLTYIDHLTHNVYRGEMDTWAGFYERLFNFREIRYFDIEGKLTGLKSRAMTSPCGRIRIPINESADDQSQIEEFLRHYNGEGIQHVALGTDDIFSTVVRASKNGVRFLDTPDTYYDMIDARIPGHDLDLEQLRKHRILVDGAPTEGQGLLLQIFTENVIGPIFFELIERRGNKGFGEGNFRALFESIEQDQIRRGVIKTE